MNFNLGQFPTYKSLFPVLRTKTTSDIEFLNPENPDYWMMHLRRFFSRAGLLSREVGIIRGICRKLARYAHHK